MASALAQQRADLEARREYMERLLRYATTGVISTDTTGRLVTMNPAAHELLSADVHQLRVGTDLIAALEQSDELAPLARALREAGDRRGESVDVDLEHGGKPRRLRFVRINLREASGRLAGTLILVDDVTELMRSNQLEAWAEMARAIAHEIKNPLTPIQLSTDHLRRVLRDHGVPAAPEIEACLNTVSNQVRALHDIAGEFSAFAKLPVLARAAADPVELMRDVIAPYRAARPPGIAIEEHYERVDAVAVDRKVLSRAVINLVENALQAMPDGGTLSVGVSRPDGRAEVALTVADTGVGLSAEARRRLFEPYFSTKTSGTGLGLAIVRRAVEAHRGRVEIESEPARGTTVRILLPSIAAPPGP
jgi:nitrogen fixation/metabolism regulation signal transduction histidine kinase